MSSTGFPLVKCIVFETNQYMWGSPLNLLCDPLCTNWQAPNKEGNSMCIYQLATNGIQSYAFLSSRISKICAAANNPLRGDGCSLVFIIVQSPRHVRLFTTPWTIAHQASLSLTVSQSLPKFMSIESVMPSNHFILIVQY